MADHSTCRQTLLDGWKRACAEVGDSPETEITVSTEPPLVHNPYIAGLECPHGVQFWIEPTSDQIAQWRQEATMPP